MGTKRLDLNLIKIKKKLLSKKLARKIQEKIQVVNLWNTLRFSVNFYKKQLKHKKFHFKQLGC